MAELFNLVFEGRTADGQDPAAVKRALGRLLKADANAVERLFSGKPVTVKHNLDAGRAAKFKQAFEATGAKCRLVPLAGEKGGAAPEPPPLPEEKVKNHFVTLRGGGRIILTSIESVPDKTIVEHFGIVSGSTIRAKHVGKDILAAFKNLVGGELKAYTQLLQESREEAVARMVEEARQLGANAVVNVRFSTSSVAAGAAELYAYGTAVSVR